MMAHTTRAALRVLEHAIMQTTDAIALIALLHAMNHILRTEGS